MKSKCLKKVKKIRRCNHTEELYEFPVYSVEPIGSWGQEGNYRNKYKKIWIKIKRCAKCHKTKLVQESEKNEK